MLNDIFRQLIRITNGPCQHGSQSILIRTDNTADFQIDTVVIQIVHTGIGVRKVLVQAGCIIITIPVGVQYHPEIHIADFPVCPFFALGFHFFSVHGSFHNLRHVFGGFQAKGIQCQVVQFVILVQDKHNFIIVLRPGTVDQIILAFQKTAGQFAVFTGKHFLPHVQSVAGHGTHLSHGNVIPVLCHGRHIDVHVFFHQIIQQLGRIGTENGTVRFFRIRQEIHIVCILDSADRIMKAGCTCCIAFFLFQPGSKGLQVIFPCLHVAEGIDQIICDGIWIDRIQFMIGLFVFCLDDRIHQGSQIRHRGFNGQRIGG